MTVTLDDLAAMRVAEPCAGVGGMASGFEAQGFRSVWFAEVDAYCRRVLAHHFPEAGLYSDLNDLVGQGPTLVEKHGKPLVYCGGTPCQDLSVAGLRRGLKGARSGLFYNFMALWDEIGSPLCLWENVPGALSSHGGKDFARVLGAFVGLRFAVPRLKRRGERIKWPRAGVVAGPAGVAAWRVLDAQYFGVPQRRRRLFVLGSRSDLFDPRAILLDPEGVRGDPPAGEAAWEGLAARLGDGAQTARLRLARAGRAGSADAGHRHAERDAAAADRGESEAQAGGDAGSLHIAAFDYKQSAADCSTDVSPTVRATEHLHGNANGGGHVGIVAFRKAQRAHSATDGETWVDADVSPTLNAHDLEGSDIRATTVVFGPKGDIADPVSANEHKTWTHEGTTFRTHNVVVGAESEAFGFKASHFTRGKDGSPSPVMPPLSADADKGDQDAVIFQPPAEVAPTVNGSQRQQVDGAMTVDGSVGIPRRLMPVECEKLQGWEPGWTNVPKVTSIAGSDAVKSEYPSDAKRYRAIGNGVAKPVAQWIAWRIRLAAIEAYLTLSGK